MSMEKIIQEIGKWSERYGKELEIGIKKSTRGSGIGLNLLNVMRVALKETKELPPK